MGGGGGVEPLGETPVNDGVFDAKEVFAGTAGGLKASPLSDFACDGRRGLLPFSSANPHLHLPRAPRGRRGSGAKAAWRAEPSEVGQNLWPPRATRLVTAPAEKHRRFKLCRGDLPSSGRRDEKQVKHQGEAPKEDCRNPRPKLHKA